jgi:co-chaperonin GroES (HSP10)
MAEPKSIGNRATEQGEFEGGADFEGINASGLPMSADPLNVKLEWDTDGKAIQLTPERQKQYSRSLAVRHSDTDMMASQILDDPEMTDFSIPNVGKIQTSRSRVATAITRNQNREQLIWFGIDSQNMSAALGDRIIVRRDLTESEYICRDCRGKGHTDETCGMCEGHQQRDGIPCKHCQVLGFEGEKPHPSGYKLCPVCRGAGWRNGIIIPEVAQGKPVTGVVVSLGPQTTLLKLGDRVLHSKYSGHTLEMKSETYTYMRETEVISLLRALA